MTMSKEVIRNLIKEAGLEINLDDEDFDKPFSVIGLDSLDVFALLTEVQVVFGLEFSNEEFVSLKSLSDVENKLKNL